MAVLGLAAIKAFWQSLIDCLYWLSITPGVIILNKANGKVNIVAGALPFEAVMDAVKQVTDK